MGGLANLIRWHNFEGILVYLLLVVQMTSLHLYCENKFTDLHLKTYVFATQRYKTMFQTMYNVTIS